MKNTIFAVSLIISLTTVSAVMQHRFDKNLLQQWNSPTPSSDPVTSYIKGVLSGFGISSYYNQISSCLDTTGVQDLLTDAHNQLDTETIASILIGLEDVGTASQVIVDAAVKCNVNLPNQAAIQEGINELKSPGSFDYVPGQSLWVNGYEIYHQLYRGRELLDNGGKNAWNNFGRHVARAIVRLVLADNAPIEDDMTNFINEVGNFEAALPPQFQGKSIRELAGSLSGTLPEADEFVIGFDGREEDGEDLEGEEVLLETAQTAANFDARTQWPGCIRPITDQGMCGSCWAFATAAALGDRLCINSSGLINMTLSTQNLISCDTAEFGCNGGYLSKTWRFLESTGVFTEACSPYQSYEGTSPATYTCGLGTTCADASRPTLAFARVNTTNKFTSISTIQNNILRWGPITCTMTVYEDFYAYSSGVYVYTTGANTGSHAIKIVGWGTDATTGQRWWNVANSWGTGWGENGYFRIQMGQAAIETNCWGAQADSIRSGK